MKSSLCRMYLVDTQTNERTPGQFLRANAYILGISPDGRYVIYHATSYKKQEHYIAISRPPYFTAKIFLPNADYARFLPNGSLEVVPALLNRWGKSTTEERIDSDCPFSVIRRSKWRSLLPPPFEFWMRKSIMDPSSFPSEAFEEVPPADWALTW